jgi:hypothetical protein
MAAAGKIAGIQIGLAAELRDALGDLVDVPLLGGGVLEKLVGDGRERFVQEILLEASAEGKDDEDENDDAEASARIKAPSAAVGPRRQSADERQHQHDDQNCRQHGHPPCCVGI